MKNILLFLFFSLPFMSRAGESEALKATLAQLDAAIAQREMYIADREQRIASLKNILENSVFSDEQRYALNRRLIAEYMPYQADSTIALLYRNIALAEKMKDRWASDESRIELATLYGASGIYLEATEMLGQIDTAALDRELLIRYYVSRHKLNDELNLYSHDPLQNRRSGRLAEFYARGIIRESAPDSEICLRYELWLAMRAGRRGEAMRIVDRMLEGLSPLERPYATVAYMKALIADQNHDLPTAQVWWARSAMTDIRLAIRDNAALKDLANTLLDDHHIERAMRYMRIVMDDARFFNSRLRPWQDTQALHEIEDAYRVRKARMETMYFVFGISVVVFLLLALAGALFLGSRNRKLRMARAALLQAYGRLNTSNDDLQRINSRLVALNDEISEANRVKEEYIGVFLLMCSEYIDKIGESRRQVRRMLRDGDLQRLKQEYGASDADQRELEEFYRNFDTTFLQLYPTFIEEFNALLEEEARIEPRKGELLTTGLRVFALIRLGITDSSKIAALLRYSVSTIYNLRSKIKGHTLLSRDAFEQRIRTIGSFSRDK